MKAATCIRFAHYLNQLLTCWTAFVCYSPLSDRLSGPLNSLKMCKNQKYVRLLLAVEMRESLLPIEPVHRESLHNGRGFANDHWVGLIKVYAPMLLNI